MGRLRGCLWLTAGLVVALIAGVIGYMALTRASAQKVGDTSTAPTVTVVIASKAVPARTLLQAEHVATREMAVDVVPEGALRSVDQAIGMMTLADLFPGEVILAQRVVNPTLIASDGRTAVLMAGEEVLVAIPASALMSRIRVLKPGDHVDLLFSLEVETPDAQGGATSRQMTFDLLQNLVVAALIGGQNNAGEAQGNPAALLLTVRPQDALALKYVVDAGAIEDIILRAPGVEEQFDTQPVDLDYLIDRYQLPVGVGR